MSASPSAQIRHLYLDPGQHAVGDRHCRFRTLLGSCVSITLWHPGRRIGAMSHFLLPYRATPRTGPPPGPPDARYGDEALTLMLDGLTLRGVRVLECEAKIFGGGVMFPDLDAPHGGVGRRNGEAARHMLDALGIPVRSESLFGHGYRTVVFDVDSGAVWSRQFLPETASVKGSPA